MCLIKWMINVLKWRKRAFIAIFFNTSVIILFYYLLFENSKIIYPSILSLFVFVMYFIFEGVNYYKFEKRLKEAMISPEYKIKGVDFSEYEFLERINTLHRKYLQDIYIIENEFKERDILFSHWIHNIKTSVSVIDLACEKMILEDTKTNEIIDIQVENNLLKKELEEGLNILRLEEFAKDYVTQKYELNALITEVINKKKRDFIYAGIFPVLDIEKNILVYTDKKWLTYVLEQIISNGIKYSKRGEKLYIKGEFKNEKAKISIIDKGIGIKKEELRRVFDAFYTGSNGRENRNSTGIGLYMAKRVCEKLNHNIDIESKVGEGTEVYIEF